MQLAVGIAAWDGAVRLLVDGAAQLHLHRADTDVVFEEAARRLVDQLLVGPRRGPWVARRVTIEDGLEGGVREDALGLVGAQLEGFAEVVEAGRQLADRVAEGDDADLHLQERAVVAQHLDVSLPRLTHARAPRDELAQEEHGVVLGRIVGEEVDVVVAPVPVDAARPPLRHVLLRHRGDAVPQLRRSMRIQPVAVEHAFLHQFALRLADVAVRNQRRDHMLLAKGLEVADVVLRLPRPPLFHLPLRTVLALREEPPADGLPDGVTGRLLRPRQLASDHGLELVDEAQQPVGGGALLRAHVRGECRPELTAAAAQAVRTLALDVGIQACAPQELLHRVARLPDGHRRVLQAFL
eukprot:6503463-Prymnesium_polylepis.1